MGRTYTCDVCDKRIKSGYTVAWGKTLKENPTGIHYSNTRETRHLCADCFPDEGKSLTNGILGFLSQ